MTNTTKRPTKKDNLNVIKSIIEVANDQGFELPEEFTFEDITAFIDHEVELLDSKAAAAQKRAAEKKVEGDILRDKIYEVLSETDFMTITQITEQLNDPDVSNQMVTARLKQLNDLQKVEKTQLTVASSVEGGKSKKLSAYKKLI